MTTATPTRGYGRWFGALVAQSALVQVMTFVLRPTATYRAIELGVAATWLGFLSAAFAIVPLVLALPAGQAVDRFGERRVMAVGSALLCASVAVFVTAGDTLAGLLAGMALLGTGQMFAVVGQQSLVANRVPVSRFDAAFGHYTLAASLGQALGPGFIFLFGGDQLIPNTGAIFLAAGVPAAALLVATALLPRTAPGTAAQARAGASIASLLRLPGLLRALVVSGLVIASIDVLGAYLPALGAERGIASGVIGFLLTVRAVASMASRLFLGSMTRALGRRRILVGALTITAAGIALLAVPLSTPTLTAIMAVLGFALGVCQPLTMSWLAETSPAGQRGRAMSLRLTSNRLSQVLLPAGVGLVAAGTGAAGVLAAIAIATGVAAFTARRFDVSR